MADEVESQLLADVLAIVSHDLRTPLSVVHTTASMLLNPKYQLTPEQIREQHERIRRNADLMNRMLGDLSDMVALHSGKLSIDPKPMAIDQALRDVVTTQTAAAQKNGVTLNYEGGADALQTNADRARLTQLFQTLIGNALKSSQAGDRVTISSRAQDHLARIEVVDSGSSIAAEDLPQVFDSRTIKGLGLYIAKGIVEAHGGQIRCTSQPGVGTTFSITLPLAV